MAILVGTKDIKHLGLRQYGKDELSNLNIGGLGCDILKNGFDVEDPVSGNGKNGSIVHEAIITDDGEVPIELAGTVDGAHLGSATSIAVNETIDKNVWIKIGNEIMWVHDSVANVLTVVRAQQNTVAKNLIDLQAVYYLGETPSVLTKAFSHKSNYWAAIKCVSNSDTTVSVALQVQAKSLIGDHLSSSVTNNYNPETQANFVPMLPGDIIYGKFNRVSLDEPNASGNTHGVKLILIRG